MPRKSERQSNNSNGANQFRSRPILEDMPELPQVLQQYVNDGVLQKNMPDKLLDDHRLQISLRSVQDIMKKCSIVTTRRNGLTHEQKMLAVDTLEQDDPLGKWGKGKVKEKLRNHGIHIPRDYIGKYRSAKDKKAAEARAPGSGKKHPHGIWSLGPNEEWCVDGHEKILRSMGIAVWGINDKCCRMELGLWATPNARVQALPPALFLREVKRRGGMPLSTTGDKGSELGQLISLVTAMRAKYFDMPENVVPAFKAVKSTSNITRERGWRPIWETELGNVLHEYQLRKAASGFQENDPLHSGISSWLWGRIVQLRLDDLRHENEHHRIRKQRKILLPSGVTPIEVYTKPEAHDLQDCLIKIPMEDIDQLLSEFDRPDLLQFGSDEAVALCEEIYAAIGSPNLKAKVGWDVFGDMVEYYMTHMQ